MCPAALFFASEGKPAGRTSNSTALAPDPIIPAVQEYAYIHDENDVPETLMEVPFLEAFTKEHLDQVLHASAFIECDPGDVIIAEGDQASRIFILLAGEVAVVKGGDQLVTMNHTGDIFGELAALEDEVRSASVVAVEESFCLAVDQKFLEHVLPKEDNAPFYAALYEFIAKLTTMRLKETSRHLAEIDMELRQLRGERDRMGTA